MAEWIKVEGQQISAVLSVCQALTNGDPEMMMCILVSSIVELDGIVKEQGYRNTDAKLDELVAGMIRDHTYHDPTVEGHA